MCGSQAAVDLTAYEQMLSEDEQWDEFFLYFFFNLLFHLNIFVYLKCVLAPLHILNVWTSLY